MNMREQAITQKQAEGWFQYLQTGKWKRFRSATVGKDGHEIDSPSQPPPMITGTNNTIVSAAYEPKFLDNAEIREYPLGTEVAQPLTKAQLLYKSNLSKQKYQAKQEANAAMAMKAMLGMDKYQRRDYLRKHDLREKRLPNGKSIILPDEDKQRVMMLRERQRVLAENQARLAEEAAKRHTSDNIAINQLARAVELATPEEKVAIARQLLGDELLAALARLKQQEQAS